MCESRSMTMSPRKAMALLLSGRQEIGEVLLRGDLLAGDAKTESLGREHVLLRAVPLEAVGMEVLAHGRRGVLELGLEPRRGVREAALCRGERVVGGDEGVGEAAGDPAVRLERLPAQHDQVLGWKRAGLAEVPL